MLPEKKRFCCRFLEMTTTEQIIECDVVLGQIEPRCWISAVWYVLLPGKWGMHFRCNVRGSAWLISSPSMLMRLLETVRMRVMSWKLILLMRCIMDVVSAMLLRSL